MVIIYDRHIENLKYGTYIHMNYDWGKLATNMLIDMIKLEFKNITKEDIYKTKFFTEFVIAFSQSMSKNKFKDIEKRLGKGMTLRLISAIITKLDPNIPRQVRVKENLETSISELLEDSETVKDTQNRIDNIKVIADKGAIVQIGLINQYQIYMYLRIEL